MSNDNGKFLDTWTYPDIELNNTTSIDCEVEWTDFQVNLSTKQVRQLEIDTLFQRVVDIMESCGPESSNNFKELNTFRTRIVRLYTNMVDLEKMYHTTLQQLWRIYKTPNYKPSVLPDPTNGNNYIKLNDLYNTYKQEIFGTYHTSNPTMKDLLGVLPLPKFKDKFTQIDQQFIISSMEEYRKYKNIKDTNTEIYIMDVLDMFQNNKTKNLPFINTRCKTLAEELKDFTDKLKMYSDEAGELERLCNTIN